MAQPQSQTNQTSNQTSNQASSANTGRNTPATRMQTRGGGGQLTARDQRSWAGSPFGLMRRLSDDMDQLFSQLIGGTSSARSGAAAAALPFVADAAVDWVPALETFERDGKFVVQADLPGLGADDVTVEVDDGLLTISGERREERELDDDGVHRTERRYGRFTRAIVLPEGARAEEVQAAFRNGVLEITVPLSQQTQQRRTVEIQGQSGNGGQSSGASSGAKTSASGSTGSGS